MLKGKTPLVIALVLGAFAGIVAWSAIKKKESDVRKGWDLVPVLVAVNEVSEGTTIELPMIAQRQIPERFVTASVVKPEYASYIVGQKVLVPLQKGDPLLWTQFQTTRDAERLSSKVQKKTRAITIEADTIGSVGGWVRPNDHVDVIGVFRDPNTNEPSAVTLLQNVIVLATGKITGTTNVNLIAENKRDYNTVSLMVVPEEAEILVLASELGRLSLSLRNDEDPDMIEERGRATVQTLLTNERTRVLQEKRDKLIPIIRSSGDKGLAAPGPQ
jgi:pilus assembly protein CpaB